MSPDSFHEIIEDLNKSSNRAIYNSFFDHRDQTYDVAIGFIQTLSKNTQHLVY